MTMSPHKISEIRLFISVAQTYYQFCQKAREDKSFPEQLDHLAREQKTLFEMLLHHYFRPGEGFHVIEKPLPFPEDVAILMQREGGLAKRTVKPQHIQLFHVCRVKFPPAAAHNDQVASPKPDSVLNTLAHFMTVILVADNPKARQSWAENNSIVNFGCIQTLHNRVRRGPVMIVHADSVEAFQCDTSTPAGSNERVGPVAFKDPVLDESVLLAPRNLDALHEFMCKLQDFRVIYDDGSFWQRGVNTGRRVGTRWLDPARKSPEKTWKKRAVGEAAPVRTPVEPPEVEPISEDDMDGWKLELEAKRKKEKRIAEGWGGWNEGGR